MNELNEKVTTIDLLRHGACEGGEIYRGTTDVALSDLGWAQMEQAIGQAGDWQRVLTSPLLRCRMFAEHCAGRLGLPVQIASDMREIDFGDWEGRLREDVWRDDPALVSSYYADPAAVTPPGGESTVAALQRITQAWQELFGQFAGENLLLVCHGGVIRLLLSHVLDMPLAAVSRVHIPYAAIARVRIYHRDKGDFPVLVSLNANGAEQ